MYYYRFDVTAFVDEKTAVETGIIAAESYAKAAADIVEFYGEANVEDFKLSVLSDNPLMVDSDTIEEIRKEVIW